MKKLIRATSIYTTRKIFRLITDPVSYTHLFALFMKCPEIKGIETYLAGVKVGTDIKFMKCPEIKGIETSPVSLITILIFIYEMP